MPYTVTTATGTRIVTAFSAWIGPRHFEDLEPDTLAALLARAKDAEHALTITVAGVVDAYGFPPAVNSSEAVRFLYSPEGRILWGRLTSVALTLLRATGGDVARLSGPRHKDARVRLLSELLGRVVPASAAGINALRERLYELAGIPEDTLAGQRHAFTAWLSAYR